MLLYQRSFSMFLAYTGLNPSLPMCKSTVKRVPRIYEVSPDCSTSLAFGFLCSPYTRGCTSYFSGLLAESVDGAGPENQ